MARRRLTIQDAAAETGATVDALRSRIRRGSLDSEKGDDGRVYVWIDDEAKTSRSPCEAQASDEPKGQVEGSELIEALRDQVRFLERQLEEANTRDRENRRIIAGLTSRIPEIESPSDPLRNEQNRGQGSSEGNSKGFGAEPSEANFESESVAPAAPRSWWRRIFGS